MVYKPCFEEVYLDIRNQSGCLCVMSFLKAVLYCTLKNLQQKEPNLAKSKMYKFTTIQLNIYIKGLFFVEFGPEGID